jgi:cellulose synthase/poly-beta-1,6-N-acetylglucosamine synthase-like glycosyltransferase
MGGSPPPNLPGVPDDPSRWLDPGTRVAIKQALVLFALAPLTLIIAVKVAHIVGDPILNLYGISVLLATMSVMFLAFARYRDPSRGPAPEGPRPLVTCLVAVHNELGHIENCLNSLVWSSYEPKEVIVIDDCSTDGTAELLRALVTDLGIKLISLDRNVGKKRALVEGAKLAQGEIFVFTDSDCTLAPDAIERCVLALRTHPDIGAVSGHARALNADVNLLTRMQDVWYDGQFGVQKAAESVFGSVTCVSGPLAVVRREAVMNYLPAWVNDRFAGAPFRFATDRQLTGYVLGQAWIGARLKAAYADDPLVTDVDYPARKWRVEYVKSARVLTIVPSTIRAFGRQQIRWKKSFIRNIFFTGTFIWRRGIGPALLYYFHLLFVIAAPILAFRHLVILPLSGAIFLTFLYLSGVFLKGTVWAIAYKIQNPRSSGWKYRPLMSLTSTLALSWLLAYSALTLRRGVWSRG